MKLSSREKSEHRTREEGSLPVGTQNLCPMHSCSRARLIRTGESRRFMQGGDSIQLPGPVGHLIPGLILTLALRKVPLRFWRTLELTSPSEGCSCILSLSLYATVSQCKLRGDERLKSWKDLLDTWLSLSRPLLSWLSGHVSIVFLWKGTCGSCSLMTLSHWREALGLYTWSGLFDLVTLLFWKPFPKQRGNEVSFFEWR